MNLSEMDDRLLMYIGTVTSDRALSQPRRHALLNDALNELRAEMPVGHVQIPSTWTPDGGTGRVYSLAGLTPSASALLSVVSIRLESVDGPRLREVSFEQLKTWTGYAYAVVGADETAILHTSPDVPESATLYAIVETWPAELTANDSPAWLSARFHDVPPLMAAQVAFGAGAEGQMPRELADKLLDRRAQLRAHVTRRSADVSKTREPESVVL